MKEIQTNGITILLVEVPEDASYFFMDYFYLVYTSNNSGNKVALGLPQANYQILGKSTELSDEQMKEIVEPAKHSSLECFIDPKDDTYTKSIDCYNRPRWTKITSTFYKDYAAKQKPRSMTWLGEVKTIQESYLSLLEANGIVDRCLIDKPEFNYEFGEDGPTDSQLLSAEIHFEESFRQYQEAQSKVKHYLVLKRI